MLIYTYFILVGVLLIVIVYSLLFSKTHIPDTTRCGVPCKIHPVHAEFRYI